MTVPKSVVDKWAAALRAELQVLSEGRWKSLSAALSGYFYFFSNKLCFNGAQIKIILFARPKGC